MSARNGLQSLFIKCFLAFYLVICCGLLVGSDQPTPYTGNFVYSEAPAPAEDASSILCDTDDLDEDGDDDDGVDGESHHTLLGLAPLSYNSFYEACNHPFNTSFSSFENLRRFKIYLVFRKLLI